MQACKPHTALAPHAPRNPPPPAHESHLLPPPSRPALALNPKL
jgi:hypothetical protein